MSVHQDHRKKMAQVIAKAWSDAAFKKKLLQNPKAALKEAGVTVPANVEVHVHEDQPSALHLVLPRKPKPLSKDELPNAASAAARMTSMNLTGGKYTAQCDAYTFKGVQYTIGPEYTTAAYTKGPEYTIGAKYTLGEDAKKAPRYTL
jgi:hypothetical protein